AIVLALLVDVAARRERARPGARDDDAADLVIGAHARDRVVQLHHQLMVHRVELVGAIQREDRDALRLLDQDVVGHGYLPARGPRTAPTHDASWGKANDAGRTR